MLVYKDKWRALCLMIFFFSAFLSSQFANAAPAPAVDFVKLFQSYAKVDAFKQAGQFKSHRFIEGQLLVFISLSLPKESLRALFREAKTHEAILVLRGLVNNSFKQTLALMQREAGEELQGFIIDPTLFKRFAVNKVPTFVLSQAGVFDEIAGDLSIAGVLTKFAERGDLSARAKALIDKARLPHA